MIFFLYIVLVFLVLRFSVTLFNFLSNPKIGNYGRSFTDKVLIIIKVKQSEEEAAQLIASISAQDYKNYEILIQRIHRPDVIAAVNGAYFLFLDANTLIQRGFINSLIYRTTVFKLAMLSVIPTPRISGFIANCIYPLTDFVLLNLFPLRLVRLLKHPSFSMVNGACLFFDADVYRQYEWDDTLKYSNQGALEMMKMVKQEKLNAELLLGNKLIDLEESKADMTDLSRRLMLNFNQQPIVALAYLILVVGGPIAMALTLAPVFLLLPYGLIFLSRMMIAYLTAQKPIPSVLYHPLHMISLTWLVMNQCWNSFLAVFKSKN
ncbi:hypothetical protein QG516_11785 [Pedobacter gandavensis]|uniref:glycosyltransferase family 2 protein n=1 Tax=Pedobacter gandavensis TaxID=2679963 RepID=UPI002479CCCF|nr:hypothetical protein [Pedobacter gandavensis]WGQ12306.1 hypothetical protein QG516_11785 [Pedobacter gandavensis]